METEILEPVYAPPVVLKRIVIEEMPGCCAIIGTTLTQPPDMIEIEGRPYNLVGLRKNRYYLYKPLMAPARLLGNGAMGDGTFKPNQL